MFSYDKTLTLIKKLTSIFYFFLEKCYASLQIVRNVMCLYSHFILIEEKNLIIEPD